MKTTKITKLVELYVKPFLASGELVGTLPGEEENQICFWNVSPGSYLAYCKDLRSADEAEPIPPFLLSTHCAEQKPNDPDKFKEPLRPSRLKVGSHVVYVQWIWSREDREQMALIEVVWDRTARQFRKAKAEEEKIQFVPGPGASPAGFNHPVVKRLVTFDWDRPWWSTEGLPKTGRAHRFNHTKPRIQAFVERLPFVEVAGYPDGSKEPLVFQDCDSAPYLHCLALGRESASFSVLSQDVGEGQVINLVIGGNLVFFRWKAGDKLALEQVFWNEVEERWDLAGDSQEGAVEITRQPYRRQQDVAFSCRVKKTEERWFRFDIRNDVDPVAQAFLVQVGGDRKFFLWGHHGTDSILYQAKRVEKGEKKEWVPLKGETRFVTSPLQTGKSVRTDFPKVERFPTPGWWKKLLATATKKKPRPKASAPAANKPELKVVSDDTQAGAMADTQVPPQASTSSNEPTPPANAELTVDGPSEPGTDDAKRNGTDG